MISDHDWEFLSTMKTLQEPREPMARLVDLLEYLAEPGHESVWVFLDIKIDDTPEDMIPKIAETFAAVPQGEWNRRIVLGCWTVKHLRLCREILPDFAIGVIDYVGARSREYLEVRNVAMNMRQESLFTFGGPQFRERCKEEGRPVYAWTINDKSWMKWCIENKIDCVVTDDPRLYLEVCANHKGDQAESRNKVFAGVIKLRDLVLSVLYLLLKLILPRVLRVSQKLGYPHEVREGLRKM